MTNRLIHAYGLIIAVVVVLSGLLLPDTAAGAPEEQIGITVSHTPEPGWNPDQTGTRFRTVAFIGGAVALLAVCAGFFILKKIGKSAKAVPKQEPAVRPAPVVEPRVSASPAVAVSPAITPPAPASGARNSAPPSSEPAAPPSEEDMLVKHLDLLKQLQSKEKV